jgi:hypothetical protein
MTTEEAFQETMDAVTEIHQAGNVTVEIKPYTKITPELLEKYGGPERVHHSKWCNVKFKTTDRDACALIAKKATHLGWLGISFDTGGMLGQRDWELDWSFKYTGRPDGDREEARDTVEDLLTTFVEGGAQGPPVEGR